MLFILPLLMMACTPHEKENVKANESKQSTPNEPAPNDTKLAFTPNTKLMIDSLSGDFDGDGKMEIAEILTYKAGAVDDNPWKMQVVFSDNKFPNISFESNDDYADLILYHNLNGIPGDELAVLIPPNHATMQFLQPYTFSDNKWHELFDGFMTPSFMPDDDSINYNFAEEDRIIREGSDIYYYDYQNVVDKNGEEKMKFVKVKAKLTATER